MIVVADTSPLNYLVQIDHHYVLPELYERVLIPPAVLRELSDPRAPQSVRSLVNSWPDWLTSKTLGQTPGADLEDLHAGEREVIGLAHEMDAELVLMDERLGVRRALNRNFRVSGTLGILVDASKRNLVNIEVAVRRLRTTRFRCTDELLQSAVRLAGL